MKRLPIFILSLLLLLGVVYLSVGQQPTIMPVGPFTEPIRFDKELIIKELSAAPSHLSNYGKLYVKASDGHLYFKDDAGTATDLTTTGTTFIGMTDTPANYTGSSLKGVRVNVGETALEFYTLASYQAGDDVESTWGDGLDFTIQYDEDGDDTAQLSLPSAGLSLRTSATDTDNALLIKVAKAVKVHNSDLFNADGLSDSAVVWQQPANSVLLSAKYVLDTQFADGSLTDIDVELGDSGDNDGIINIAGNLTSDAAGTEYSIRGAYWSATTAGGYHSASAKDWTAYATAVGANLNTTSAGQITFYFAYIQF